jgi:hypothetical protein
VASNYSIYAPRGAAPLTSHNVETLAALREGDGGQPVLLTADSSIVMGVLDEECAQGEYGGPAKFPKTLTEAHEVAITAKSQHPWLKRWTVLFGGWIGLFLNGFFFNSSTLLIPFLDAHAATAGTGVLCVMMINTSWY